MGNPTLKPPEAVNGATTVSNQSYQFGVLQNFQLILYNKWDSSKALDITAHVLDCNLYEDIFSQCLFGDIVLIDAIDLLNGIPGVSANQSFPILGEEVISLTFNVLGQTPYTGIFEIYGISEIKTDDNIKMRTFSLKFCSREKIVDGYTLIQKGFNQPISDTANAIFTSFLTQEVSKIYNGFGSVSGALPPKGIICEATNGPQKIVIPRLSPFETMEFLRKRSLSANSSCASGSYLFFESLDSYHFCDIETLITAGIVKQGTGDLSAPDAVSTYKYSMAVQAKDDVNLQQGGVTSSSFPQYKIITSFTQHNKFDTVEKLKLGVFQSDMLQYDFINNNILDTSFTLANAPPVITLGKYLENSESFTQNMAEAQGKYTRKFFGGIDTSLPPTHMDQIITRKTSYFARLSENFFTINTLGDQNIKVGDVIYLALPTLIDDGQAVSTPDKFLAGNFLIGSIKHKLTPISYHTTLDLYKIGYEAAVNSPASDNAFSALASAVGINTQQASGTNPFNILTGI